MNDEVPSEGAAGAAPPRRLHARSLAWIAALVVALGVAVGVTLVAGGSEPDPPADPGVYCAEALALRSGPGMNLDVGGSTADLDAAVASLDRMIEAAPAMADPLGQVRDAILDVIDLSGQVDPDDPGALAEVSALIEEQSGRLSAPSEEVSAYTDRWCSAP